MTAYPAGLPDRTPGAALAAACDTLVEDAHQAWSRLDRPDDGEALHDFRVAIRRLRSVLRAFRPYLAPAIPKKLRRQLRDLQRETNAARDAEVQIAWIRERHEELTRGQWAGARWLLVRLEKTRDEGYAASAGSIAATFPRLERRLRKRLQDAAGDEQSDHEEPAFAAVCADLVREHLAELQDGLASVTDPTCEAEVHATRIAAKRVRYLVELVQRDVAPARLAVRHLKRLQDLLGDLHDAQVADDELGEACEIAAAEHARRLHDLEGRPDPDRRRRRRALTQNAVPGLLALARARQAQRETLFAQFVRDWRDGRRAKLRTALERALAELDGHRTAPPTVEIERKYLLSGLPAGAGAGRSVEVDQGWLPGMRLVERIRRVRAGSDETFLRAVKLGTGIARTEIEDATTREVFDRLWPLTEGRRVHKRRHYLPDGGLTWEIDEFLDRDLVLAEVELPTVEAAVSIPSWLAPVLVREVTGEPEYLNVNLAR